MIVKEVGNYKCLEPVASRGSFSVGTFPQGSIIKITQIDPCYHKVMGEGFHDWIFWDLPVKKCKKGGINGIRRRYIEQRS